MRNRYNCLLAYKHTKLCNVLFTVEFKPQDEKEPQFALSPADPGLVNTEIGLKGTGGIEKWFWNIRMKGGVAPCVPGKALAFLAGDPLPFESGEPYWYSCKPKRPNAYALNANAGRLLWEASERLCMIE